MLFSRFQRALTCVAAVVALFGCEKRCRPWQKMENGVCVAALPTLMSPGTDGGVGAESETQLGGAAAVNAGRDEAGKGGTLAARSGSGDKSDAHSAGMTAGKLASAGAGGADGSEQSSAQGAGGSAPATPVCGNGIVEPGEKCDGKTCPTVCPTPDPASCLRFEFSGSASACDAECNMHAVTECRSGDGCCATGCKYPADTDCSKSCGDGVVTAPETCEQTSANTPCPTKCDDANACTLDVMMGSPE
jgi:hypothetical protein